MTDTPLDLDAILAAHASASPYGRTEVAGRFHASYYADDADVMLVFASIPALVAALRKAEDALVSVGTEAQDWHAAAETYRARAEKAEAQVAAVLAECRKVATVSGNASGYPYVLVNTIVGAIERAS